MNLDVGIVVISLLVNIVTGILKGTNVRSIKDFALGNRDFSTVTLVCTIIATWISGEAFFTVIAGSYSDGLYFVFARSFGNFLVLFLIGLFFIPRMAEFLGNLYIAEAMGNMYGKNVKLVSSVAGCIGVAGVIAAQFKIAGIIFEYSLGLSSIQGILIGAAIVTIYSALGGIKSVSFTDVVQLFMFGTIIPTITMFIYSALDNTHYLATAVENVSVFEFSKIFNFNSEKSLYYVFFFLWVAIPGFDPTIFQRISMAKDIYQARKSFLIASIVVLFLFLMISWIGMVASAIYPDLPTSEIVKHIIDNHTHTGFKGLVLAGVLAMMMSTADSYINSTSILFTHDFCNSVGIKVRDELTTSRLISFVLGISSLFLAIYSTDLLQLIITTTSFYMPIVTVPFMLSIIGFRSSGKSVLVGMFAGIITVIFWEIFLRGNTVDSAIPGMIANVLALFLSHYILKEPGGWIGIKSYDYVVELRQLRKQRIERIVDSIRNFNFLDFCRLNAQVLI